VGAISQSDGLFVRSEQRSSLCVQLNYHDLHPHSAFGVGDSTIWEEKETNYLLYRALN